MAKHDDSERPLKRSKLFSDESDSENSENELANTSTEPGKHSTNGFRINEEYAKRFEHNKKREELQRLEEKYKDSGNSKRKRSGYDEDDEESDEDDSTSEEEDDDAELATAELDEEIFDTLNAIKAKDPRVYDKDVKFYKEFDPDVAADAAGKSSEKPMYLHDYHRQNLMVGDTGEDAGNEAVPTYQEQEDAWRNKLIGSINETKADESDEEDDDDFLVTKSKTKPVDAPARRTAKVTDTDIKAADKDPEKYLSNFMAARAWLSSKDSNRHAFESDDSDEEARADAFEEAYNMRFEDPKTANEKLQSFARDVGKYGVRREEKSRRQLAREQEKEAKAARKQERDEERARLRKLKVEEAEEKIRRIKSVAGIKGQGLDLEEWRNVLDGDFDHEEWEEEMARRFGDAYYAEADGEGEGSDGEEEDGNQKRKAKKPKWDDDIDIKDLIPDFDAANPDVQLTSDEEDSGAPLVSDAEAGEEDKRDKRKSKKDRAREKVDAKRVARKERAKLEEMVDASISLSHPELGPSVSSSTAPAVRFRYRETSPTSFGMSSRDILFAEDAQLNQFAGLKKLAAFRDEEKKRKDKKKFSKKARLRQWRKETFGNPDEPLGGFERILGDGENAESNDKSASKADTKDRAGKKRRSKKKQKKETEA